MIFKKFFLSLLLVFTIFNFAFFAYPAVASDNCVDYCKDTVTNTMPPGIACLCSRSNPHGGEAGIIDRALNWIFYFALILCPLLVLIGAFMIMAGGGHFKKIKNTEGIESILNPTIAGGKSMIKGAVIGLALALSAKLIYAVVRFLIGQ